MILRLARCSIQQPFILSREKRCMHIRVFSHFHAYEYKFVATIHSVRLDLNRMGYSYLYAIKFCFLFAPQPLLGISFFSFVPFFLVCVQLNIHLVQRAYLVCLTASAHNEQYQRANSFTSRKWSMTWHPPSTRGGTRSIRSYNTIFTHCPTHFEDYVEQLVEFLFIQNLSSSILVGFSF